MKARRTGIFLGLAVLLGLAVMTFTRIQHQKANPSENTENDCGPQALFALLHEHQADVSLLAIEQRSFQSRPGTTLLGLKKAAESYGFKADGMRLSYDDLKQELRNRLGVIAFVNQNHYVWVTNFDEKGLWYKDLAPERRYVTTDVWAQMWFEQNPGAIPSIEEGKGICLVVYKRGER